MAVFDAQIARWLDQNLLVSRMLELARADAEHPYSGGDTAFYDYVRKERRARKQTPRDLALHTREETVRKQVGVLTEMCS